MSTKFCLLIDFDLLKTVTSTDAKPEIELSSGGRHLEKSIWRHITAMVGPIWTKFSSLTQNNMAITVKWSKMKPEVEFQYGRRLFFQTGSSYISAVNWGMWTKFGLLIDFGLLEAATSTTNTKPEVVLSGRGWHLEKVDMTLFFHNVWSDTDIDDVWQVDAKWHADYGNPNQNRE